MTTWPKTDFHLHATRYRLGNPRPEATVANMVARCEALGYQQVGIVEHLDDSPKHPLHCLEALLAEFRAVVSPVKLYAGAELDINEDDMSVPEHASLKESLGLDYYLASVHSLGPDVRDIPSFIQDHHRRTMLLVERYDQVDVIAHPWATGQSLVRRGMAPEWRFEFIPPAYLHELADGLRQQGKALELNGKARAHFDDPAFVAFMDMVRGFGVPVSIGSDAHSLERVGETAELDAFLQERGFGPGQLWTPERH